MNTNYVNQLIQLTDKLTNVLLIEIKALKEHRPSALKDTEDLKGELMKAYDAEMKKVKGQSALIKSAPSSLRNKLAQATKQFHATLDEHARLLRAKQKVTEGIIGSIAREAQKLVRPVGTYGRNAGYAATKTGAKPFAVNSVA